jgi:hypothetical protein
MAMDLIKARVRKTIELSGTTQQPPSPGWDQAVCIAAARLNEGWVLPETRCYSLAAEELAVFLCAYGG